MKNLLLFMLFFMLLAACSGTARPSATPLGITYPTAQYTDQRTLVENAGGKLEMGAVGTLPSELSRDVPIYYPGFPTGWTKFFYPNSTASYIVISLEAGADQASVLAWYRTALESNGWTIGALDAELGSMQCSQEPPQVMDAQKDLRMLRISACATSCASYCSTNVSLYATGND